MSRPRPILKSTHRLVLAVVVTTLTTFAAPAQAERIIAIGDIHGAIDGVTTILRTAGLIDTANQWSGGTATLVQTGDLTDRGEHVRRVLDLMMALENQAEAAGGRVVALLGNHEVNNLVNYFGPDAALTPDFAAIVSHFADKESEARLRKAYSDWNKWQARYPQCGIDRSRKEWIAEREPGYLEYIQALAPDGLYGAWLRKRQVAARIGDTIFLHGGLSPDPPEQFPTDTLEAINRQVAFELERFDADKAWLVDQGVILPFSSLGEMFCAVRNQVALLSVADSSGAAHERARLEEVYSRMPQPQTWLSFHPDGPIWFRGWANWTDEEGPAEIDRVAKIYGAARFVAGHTPQKGSILARFDDRVFQIDTGMVFGAAAGGRPSALELIDGETRAIYEGSEPAPESVAVTRSPTTPDASNLPIVWLDPDGRALPFSSPEEVTEFLRTASVESVQQIPVGVTKPKRLMLVQGGVRLEAAFRDVNISGERKRLSTGGFVMFFRDNYINEVAAYELSMLMGLDTIPPTVVREIDDQPGSVQLWLQGAMMETTRREKKIEPPDRVRFTRQWYDMKVFDNLINNTDRNSGNILLDADWKMWWIDHSRSFARSKELPTPQEVIGCSHQLFEALKALDEDEVTERLRPYLPMPEIRALHERRKRLIALIDERIAERGADWVLFNYGDPDNRVRIDYLEPEEDS